MADPQRSWLLNTDAHGLGGRDIRRYRTTRAAVRAWKGGYRLPDGRMVLILPNGPLDMTEHFERLSWPDRKMISNNGQANDPSRQADLDHHFEVCLADPDEADKIYQDKHVCPWFEHAAELTKLKNRDIAENTRIIEKLIPGWSSD